MKTFSKVSIIIIILVATMSILFTSCKEDEATRCYTCTTLISSDTQFTNTKFATFNMPDNSQNYLNYYNGSHYFTRQDGLDTIYYFVANADAFPITDEVAYDLTRNVWNTTNVLLDASMKNNVKYYESEILEMAETGATPTTKNIAKKK